MYGSQSALFLVIATSTFRMAAVSALFLLQNLIY